MPNTEADYEIDWDKPLPAIPVPQPKPVAQAPDADRDLAVVQARAVQAEGGEISEGAVVEDDDSDKVELLGRKFRMSDKVGLMPLLKFASASDMSTDDPRALSAIYAMLRDCIYEGKPGCRECQFCKAGDEEGCAQYEKGDWAEFERHAIDTKAEGDDLLEVVSQVMEKLSGRPTQQPGGSSTGQRTTRRASTGNSSGRRGRGSRR